MPRSLSFSPPKPTTQLSHAIDLFLHKDRTSFFDNDSIASGAILPFDSPPTFSEPSSFDWDLQATCTPLFPAFKYISNKLQQQGLSVALIVSNHEPYVIPVWPLPRKSQTLIAQVVKKAVKKFALLPSWLTALASSSNRRLPKIFETHQPDSWIVRRSLVQNEMIFCEDGLTLLNIDHIYTFKQLLRTLSKKDLVPHIREACLSSCVHLLRHINYGCTDPQLSKGYLARAYTDLEYQPDIYDEVASAHDLSYCTANIKDVTQLEPDCSAMVDGAFDHESENQFGLAAELPDTSRSVLGDVNSVGVDDFGTLELLHSLHSEESLDTIGPLVVKYPSTTKPSNFPESPLDPNAPWNTAIPSPSSTRRPTTLPSPSPTSQYVKEDWRGSIPSLPETTESWDPSIPNPPNSRNSVKPGESRSPSEYVKSWMESWGKVAPDMLCKNCHQATLQPFQPKRYTVA